MNEFLHYDDLHISRQWFEIGKERESITGEDVAFKFIAYWVAFNAFFEKLAYKNGITNKEEKNKIYNLIDKMYSLTLKGVIDFESEECDIFNKYPVFYGGTTIDESKDYLNTPSNRFHCNQRNQVELFQKYIKSDNEKEKLKYLLLTIKQVRNNLFHGNKDPYPDRNYYLVESSQIILYKLLDALIKSNNE